MSGIDYDFIRNNNTLNYWLSLCKWPPFTLKTKMHAPLPDCRINNVLIQFVPSCQDRRMQFVNVVDPPFSNIAILVLSHGNFYAEKWYSNNV